MASAPHWGLSNERHLGRPPPPHASENRILGPATPCGSSLCVGGAARESKIRGEATMAACCGVASGTLITSIRNSELLGFESGDSRTQPASSLGERTGAEPET